tara:strand:- start:159 stop:737 length:579 start_codon:yes stop_codon:yes gene_type:complete
MIYVEDDFLPEVVLNKMEEYLVNFKEINTEHKKFWVMEAEDPFMDYVINKISSIEGREIINILSFFRLATDTLDTEWRIHCDSIINNQVPERAIVLYMNNTELNKINGTAFWDHNEWGKSLPMKDLSSDIYNNLILNDSNDIEKWNINTIIGNKKNRLLSYPCNYFHSKYPNKAWKNGRKVFVMFYKTNQIK